jgi:hypothetical protein
MSIARCKAGALARIDHGQRQAGVACNGTIDLIFHHAQRVSGRCELSDSRIRLHG